MAQDSASRSFWLVGRGVGDATSGAPKAQRNAEINEVGPDANCCKWASECAPNISQECHDECTTTTTCDAEGSCTEEQSCTPVCEFVSKLECYDTCVESCVMYS